MFDQGDRFLPSIATNHGLLEIGGLNSAAALVADSVRFTETGSAAPWTLAFDENGWVDFVSSPDGGDVERHSGEVVLNEDQVLGGELHALATVLPDEQVALLEQLRADVAAERAKAGLAAAQSVGADSASVIVDITAVSQTGDRLCCFSVPDIAVTAPGPPPSIALDLARHSDSSPTATLTVTWPTASPERRIESWLFWNWHNVADLGSKAVTPGSSKTSPARWSSVPSAT